MGLGNPPDFLCTAQEPKKSHMPVFPTHSWHLDHIHFSCLPLKMLTKKLRLFFNQISTLLCGVYISGAVSRHKQQLALFCIIQWSSKTGERLVGLNTMGIRSVMVYFLSIAHTILSEADQNQSWANLRTKRKSGREDSNSCLPWSQTPS